MWQRCRPCHRPPSSPESQGKGRPLESMPSGASVSFSNGNHEVRGSTPLGSTNSDEGLGRYRLSPFSLELPGRRHPSSPMIPRQQRAARLHRCARPHLDAPRFLTGRASATSPPDPVAPATTGHFRTWPKPTEYPGDGRNTQQSAHRARSHQRPPARGQPAMGRRPLVQPPDLAGLPPSESDRQAAENEDQEPKNGGHRTSEAEY